jgi:hypothetical protein
MLRAHACDASMTNADDFQNVASSAPPAPGLRLLLPEDDPAEDVLQITAEAIQAARTATEDEDFARSVARLTPARVLAELAGQARRPIHPSARTVLTLAPE